MNMPNEYIFFGGFVIFVFVVLFFDLEVIGRNSRVISFKESAIWSSVWISFALIFFVLLKLYGEKLHGIENITELKSIAGKYNLSIDFNGNYAASLQEFKNVLSINFLSGYFLEYSLSIDNIFVILMILTVFNVQEQYYKQILFWGIIGAVVLRFLFIFLGATLVHQFSWILYLFGIFLVYSGVKMFVERNKQEKIEPQKHWLVKLLARYFNVFPRYVNANFFVRKNLKLFITPLFIVLIIIEFTDLIFALDSIPAVFAVTIDPYIVFFSNIFAIIGLRSLFFMLMKIINKFRFIKVGVAFLLFYIGIKLLAEHWLKIIGFKNEFSLYIILTTIVVSIVVSVLIPEKEKSN